ncbi:anti-sigma factor [Nocardiopsis sp. SBT366]|uniref:anti-sigma factor family protein n=1 Tax=Nocardiopsis sp. SBT366 TaxID=1580529 RepID=UPI000B1BF8D5
MTSHPDVEALAFFAEDLLDPDEERSVATHIETCASCATVLDELSGVTRVLAEEPLPALPQGVADLLDSRIAEAVSERSATSTAGDGPARDAEEPEASEAPAADTLAPVVPLNRRRGFGLPHLMAIAAVTVFVVGGGAAILNGMMSEQETTAASPLLEESESESAPDTAQSYSAKSVASGTVYTEDGLGAQASKVLSAEREPEGTDEEAGTQALTQLTTEAQECVTRFEQESGVRVTLVDDALFDAGDGAGPAWVLFTQDTDGAGVVVLDPGSCADGSPAEGVLAQRPL